MASRICAERLHSKARIAALSAVAAIASDTSVSIPGRPATAATVPGERASAISGSRSSVVSNGEKRMIGALTITAWSCASCRISARGACGMSFSTSATAARTRTAASATSAVSVS